MTKQTLATKVRLAKQVPLEVSMKETRLEIADRVKPFADRLVNQLTDALLAKLENNLEQLGKAFESALDLFDANLTEPALPRPPARKQLAAGPRAKTKPKDGKRRNHCQNCGAEGFQTKTCGKTHDKNGAFSAGSNRQPRTKTKKRLEDLADDEEPPAAVPKPIHVVAPQPPAPKAPPRSAASTQAEPRNRPPLIVSQPTLLQLTEGAKPKPKKTVPREKALNEIRIERLRRLNESRKDKEHEKTLRKADRDKEPRFDTSDAAEIEVQNLTEQEAISLSHDD